MKDDEKKKKQLINELTDLRSQCAAQEKSITEIKLAELVAQEAARYAESIMETVREPLLVLDANIKIISANRNFYATFKINPANTIGRFLYDLGNRQWDIPKLRELLEDILPKKEVFDGFEVEHTFQNIGHKIMLLNARQVYRKDIDSKIILLSIEDITDRRKIEEIQHQLAAIVGSADDAIISKDLDGIIVSWNKGAEVEYGYNQKEVIGKPISLLMPPDHPDEYKKILAKIAHDEKINNYETQRRRKDGGIIDVSLTISQIKNLSGKIIGASTIARDITKRKQTEKDIHVLNKELTSFAYSVSHDLRAPLRGIDGWSLALLEDYGDKLDDQGRKYLHRIRAETQQMGILIGDLLNLSRIARIEPQVMPLDLTAMARSIATRLQEGMPDRRIEFIIQPDLRADGDNHLVNIALTNLFDNAVKFTGTRSQARIEFGEAEVDGGRAFFVRDNGAGFDMAHAPKLFGAFQRLHKSSEFPGTGVGLATVQRIIHRHGGRIWANAQVDQGATFYFTLKETI